MSWFDTKGLTNLAKTVLSQAQKKIDQALEIEEEATQSLINLAETAATGSSNSSSADKSSTTEALADSKLGSIFGNPNASEMVTTPPKATTTTAAADVKKRQSVTSNSDSVELLSPTSACCSELPTPDTQPGNNSESVEVITTPNTSALSSTCESAASLPESIVIIDSNIACGEEDDEDSSTYNTVLDDAGQQQPQEDAISQHSNSMGLLADSSGSTSTLKPLTSTEDVRLEAQTIDSDSTQSFEEINMQHSSSSSSNNNNNNTKTNKPEMRKLTSQSSSSPQNSNDELETTTSSDIEIISNPNGDACSSSNSNNTRVASPLKLKRTTLPLGKKGHFREPSEISILSEDSQSEIDKLVHRISELNEMLESREQRLLQSERQNAALQERNFELQTMMNSNANLNTAEEYTQRVSALEKKFQISIRERDALRLQLKAAREELQNKIPKDELNTVVNDSNAMIAELRLEGEKLAKEILQQSNIIKKLRAKEKTSDAQAKKNKEEITVLSEELERLKKSLNAKAELERAQIEAVNRISMEKQKLEDENAQNRSQIEDLQSKLSTLQASFDAVKIELQQRARLHTDLTRSTEAAADARKQLEQSKSEQQQMQLQLQELQAKLRATEQQLLKREQQLRAENNELLKRLEAAELRAETTTQQVSQTTMPLMRQLEALQNTLSQRTSNWNKQEKQLLQQLDATQTRLQTLEHIELTHKEKMSLWQTRCLELEQKLANALMQEEANKLALQRAQLNHSLEQAELQKQLLQCQDELSKCNEELGLLQEQHKNLQQKFSEKSDVKANLMQEYLQQEVLPEQLTTMQQQRSHSPAASYDVNSLEDAMVNSAIDWQADDMDCVSNSGGTANNAALVYSIHSNFLGHPMATSTLEHLQALLKQRDGELQQLQLDQTRLQAERQVLNEEIATLSLELENIKDKVQSFEILEANYQDLQHRYDALLQMYGEKVERTEELELDLLELKDAYKTQIDELLAQPTHNNTG